MNYESLKVALDCLERHPTWHLFPIARFEKFPPLIKDNLELASNDPKQIRAWHAKFYGCSWGVALKKSGLIVVDVDRKAGKRGQETLDGITLEYGDLPVTLTVLTPSGGLHYYFVGEHRLALGKAGFGDGIDSPNYTLIPGCWLCTNSIQGYEIITDAPTAPAPEWFGIFLRDKAEKQAADVAPEVDLDQPINIDRMVRYLQEGAPPSVQGQGGEKALFDVSCVLKDNGISELKAIELIDTHYNVFGKCEPLWAIGEGAEADRLDVKVHNAYLYARENKVGAATAEYAFGDPTDAVDPADVKRMQEAWRVRLQAQDKKKRTDRERGMFKEEALIDPLTGEPFEPEDPPPEPPAGGAPPKKDEPGASSKAAEPPPPPEKSVLELAQRWVWVVGAERFVRISDGLMWSRSQFDSRYNHMAKMASISGALFKAENKIRRVEQIAFRPGYTKFLDGGRAFNLWRPSPIVPQEGNTDIWDAHLNYLFQNEDDRNHVLNWLAWVYQNQQSKPNHALLIVGKNTGTGKSFIARVMEKLIGKDNTQRPKNSSLKGDFNGWALRCKLCIIEELMQIGRREVANELRDTITEPTIEVNMKNVQAQLVENYMAMIGISNHPDALPIDDTDRRWLIVSTLAYRSDPEYYRRLFSILQSPEALAAIAYALQTRDLGEYDATQTAPSTGAKLEMIQLSRNDTEAWLFDNMENHPLSCQLTTISDVIASMPPTLQRGPNQRLNTTVTNFLRDRLKGEPIDQVRTSDGRRVRLWALHGKAVLLRQLDLEALAARYETERKPPSGNRTQAEQAAEDFSD